MLLLSSRQLLLHRMVEVGRNLWRSPGPTPPGQAEWPRASCPLPCPGSFWISPRLEILQPLWATCSRAQWCSTQPSLQAKEPQLSQTLLTGEMLQFLNSVWGWTLSSVTMSCTGDLRTGCNTLDVTSLTEGMDHPLQPPNTAKHIICARAHCWFMFNLVSTRISGSFSIKLHSNWVACRVFCCLGLSYWTREVFKMWNNHSQRTGGHTQHPTTVMVHMVPFQTEAFESLKFEINFFSEFINPSCNKSAFRTPTCL